MLQNNNFRENTLQERGFLSVMQVMDVFEIHPALELSDVGRKGSLSILIGGTIETFFLKVENAGFMTDAALFFQASELTAVEDDELVVGAWQDVVSVAGFLVSLICAVDGVFEAEDGT